jgi:hypothetical protein
MNLNFGMAIVWLLIGGGMVVHHWLNPEGSLVLRGTGISGGWFVLLLAVYSGVRGWSIRSAEARRRAQEEVQAQQRHAAHRVLPETPVPDPNFDFSRPAEPKQDRPS